MLGDLLLPFGSRTDVCSSPELEKTLPLQGHELGFESIQKLLILARIAAADFYWSSHVHLPSPLLFLNVVAISRGCIIDSSSFSGNNNEVQLGELDQTISNAPQEFIGDVAVPVQVAFFARCGCSPKAVYVPRIVFFHIPLEHYMVIVFRSQDEWHGQGARRRRA